MKYQKGSFVIVPNKNLLKGQSASVRSVYLSICGFADDDGQCFPSISRIASEAGVTENTVRDSLKRLTEIGLLSKTERIIEGGRNLTNLYLLLVGEGAMVEGGTAMVEPTPLQNKGYELYPIRTISTERGDLYEVRTEALENAPSTWRAKDKIIPTPYSPEKTKELWSKGERRLQVLSWFMTETGLWSKATNPVKLKQIMNRHSSAAKRIADADWELSEVKEALKKIKFNPSLEGEWTLETVEKYLTK